MGLDIFFSWRSGMTYWLFEFSPLPQSHAIGSDQKLFCSAQGSNGCIRSTPISNFPSRTESLCTALEKDGLSSNIAYSSTVYSEKRYSASLWTFLKQPHIPPTIGVIPKKALALVSPTDYVIQGFIKMHSGFPDHVSILNLKTQKSISHTWPHFFCRELNIEQLKKYDNFQCNQC